MILCVDAFLFFCILDLAGQIGLGLPDCSIIVMGMAVQSCSHPWSLLFCSLELLQASCDSTLQLICQSQIQVTGTGPDPPRMYACVSSGPTKAS